MATFAVGAEPVLMGIVFFVTRHAGRGGHHSLVHRGRMAVATAQPLVRAVQFEGGARIVVEIPQFPIARVVTMFAPTAQCSSMDIIALVASIAVERCFVLVERASMTAPAHYRSMFSEQRVGGVTIMVEV